MKNVAFLCLALCSSALWSIACSPALKSSLEKSKQEQQSTDASTREKLIKVAIDTGFQEELIDKLDTPPDMTQPESAQEKSSEPFIPRPQKGWCARITAGSFTKKPLLIALSQAHSHLRFFGVHKGYPTVDAALAQALSLRKMDDPKFLIGYTQNLPSLCILPASSHLLPKANLQMKGEVAVITPGKGEVKLPSNTKAIIIDLRNLPNSPELASAIEKVVTQALSQILQRSQRIVMQHKGLKDEYFFERNVYSNQPTTQGSGFFFAKRKQALPLAFVVGKLLPPAAARIAGTLRLAKRAWLIGNSIPTAIAESRWQGVGKAGIAFRTMQLSHNNTPWPDEIQADRSLTEFDSFLKELVQNKSIPAYVKMKHTRPSMQAYTHFRSFHSKEISKAHTQAALLIAHGALRLFFPYFHTVGDRIDKRLQETSKTLRNIALTGDSTRNLLRRFGESIRDGHCFVKYNGKSSGKGFMLIELDKLKEKPVIRRSNHPKLKVGDTLVSISGKSAADWFRNEYKRTSAATSGYKFDLVARELYRMKGSLDLELQSPNGQIRKETIQPLSSKAYLDFWQKEPFRKAGFLTALKAPNVYYVDISRKSMKASIIPKILKDLEKAKSLVLDMRGYPNQHSWKLLQHLAGKPLPSPLFLVPLWKGSNEKTIYESKYDLPALTPSFTGPIAYLIGPRSVSQAENLSTMLKQIKRVTFVGRTTAGTNGNITALALPGMLSFSFTGMEILYRDRKPFHGIGIIPDIMVEPTPKDLVKGFDRVLEKAVRFLQKP